MFHPGSSRTSVFFVGEDRVCFVPPGHSTYLFLGLTCVRLDTRRWATAKLTTAFIRTAESRFRLRAPMAARPRLAQQRSRHLRAVEAAAKNIQLLHLSVFHILLRLNVRECSFPIPPIHILRVEQ